MSWPTALMEPGESLRLKKQCGWKGGVKQKCSVCPERRQTAYACGHPSCATANSVVALCNSATTYKSKSTQHECLGIHRRNPDDCYRVHASMGEATAAARRKNGRAGQGRGRGRQ